MCPVFRAVGHEAATSRAKINLAQNYLTGNLDQVPLNELRKVTDLCLNCKMCAVDCPAGVNSADVMVELKAQIGNKIGFDRDTKVLLHMEQLLRLVSPLAFLQRTAISFAPARKLMERITGLTAERIPPKLSRNPFIKRFHNIKTIPSRPDSNTIKVAYFVDMFSDLISPQIAETFLKILKHNNIEVIVPKQKGSDIVNFTYGNICKVKNSADFNVAELSKLCDQGYTIVCTEPTAALVLKEEYPRINDNESYLKVSQNSFDASTFLLFLFERDMMKSKMKSVPVTLGYHRPCHIKKLGAVDATISLMEQIPGVKVIDINKGCCGIAGTFGMKKTNYDISMKIGAPLFEELKNGALDFGLTECSTCKLQMEHGAPGLIVKHPLEIIAEAYGL
jgi:Fe-S oxidoreductase